jgi:hypothetical protein
MFFFIMIEKVGWFPAELCDTLSRETTHYSENNLDLSEETEIKTSCLFFKYLAARDHLAQ